MAKKQTRRSVSVRGVTYAAVRHDCAARDLSMSDYIEALIAADRKARGLRDTAVAGAAAAVQRTGERQVAAAARAVQATTAAPAATSAPAPRGAATTAELRALVTEEANRLIPRLPTGYSAEDLEVAGRAAATEAVRVFEPGNGAHLVDAARPLVRRAMADRLRDLREEATAAPATSATATAKPAAPRPAPVVATAAAATTTAARPPATAGTSPTATSSPTTARAIRRPGFHSKGGAVSVSQRVWEWLERRGRPASVHEVAAAVGANFGAVNVALHSFLLRGFIEGNSQAYFIPTATIPSRPAAVARPEQTQAPSPLPRESSIKVGPAPEQTAMLGRQETPPRKVPTCPCCGRQSMKPGVRCGACAISCRPDGDGWKRGMMCPAGNRVVDVIEEEDEGVGGEEDAEDADFEGREPVPLRRAPAGFRPALRPPPPIPEGRNAASPGRPAGLRVEPVKQRSVEDTRKLVKADPIAAVHAGRSGVQF